MYQVWSMQWTKFVSAISRPRMLGGFVLYCGFSLDGMGSSWFVSDLQYIIFVRFWDFIISYNQYSKICCCLLNDNEKDICNILNSQKDSRNINVDTNRILATGSNYVYFRCNVTRNVGFLHCVTSVVLSEQQSWNGEWITLKCESSCQNSLHCPTLI